MFWPVKIIEMRSFNIPTNTQSVQSEFLYRGNLPEYVVIRFAESESFSGKTKQESFYFLSTGLQSASVSVDGQSSFYRQIDFDTDNKISLLGYNTLQTAVSDPELGNAKQR
jgi:hypothetical protein